MTLLHSPLLARTSAIAILVALIGGALVWVVLPLRDAVGENDALLREKRELLARMKLLVAPQATGSKQELERQEAHHAPHFLQGGSEPLIVASLQTRLRTIVMEAGAVLNGAQQLPRRDAGGSVRLGVRLAIHGNVDSISAILHRIDSEVPLLSVERLTLASAGAASVGPSGRARVAELAMTVDVSGAVLSLQSVDQKAGPR